MRYDSKDLSDKFWLMVSDWLENSVPNERTISRVEYLRTRLNGEIYRHQHDAMNFIVEKINDVETKKPTTPQP